MDIWTYPRISYRRCVYRQCPNATAYIHIYALLERVFTNAIYVYMRCAARVATGSAAYIRARGGALARETLGLESGFSQSSWGAQGGHYSTSVETWRYSVPYG